MPIIPRITYHFPEDEVARPAEDLTATLEACVAARSERTRKPSMTADPVRDYLTGVDQAGTWLGQVSGKSPMWRDSREPYREVIEEELDFALRVATDVSVYPDKEIGMTAEFARGVVDLLMYAIDLSAPAPATT